MSTELSPESDYNIYDNRSFYKHEVVFKF